MELLVTVPAAVEDALASLMLDPADAALQARGAVTYIRRLYHPHMIGRPTFTMRATHHEEKDLIDVPEEECISSSAEATAAAVAAASCIATSTWLYEDPLASGGGGGSKRTLAGALLMVDSLAALPLGLPKLAAELSGLGVGSLPLSLHLVVVGDESALKCGPAGDDGAAPAIDPLRVMLDDGTSLVSRSELGNAEVDPETSSRAAEQVGTPVASRPTSPWI